MVGRPREFEHDEALERAMQVFWDNGYQATSVQDLLDAMGINRGSMYDSFGDKHALFVQAVEHYGHTILQREYDILNAPGSPLANLHKLISIWVKDAGGGPRGGAAGKRGRRRRVRGCLVCNTAVELAQHDPKAADVVGALLQQLENALCRTIRSAIAAGELPKTADARPLARFLTTTAQGLTVMGKAGVSQAAIGDAARVAESVLSGL